MRPNILARRLRSLSTVSALLAVATIASACSRDAARFDEMLTASIPNTSNQNKIINRQQGYDTGVVYKDNNRVGVSSNALAPVVSRSALPSAAGNEQGIIVVKPVQTASNAVPALPAYQPPKNALVLSNRKAPSDELRQLGTDNMSTGSIKKAAVPGPATTKINKLIKKQAGWQNSKGAWVTITKGETLRDLSRRYGVPVTAIMSANKITNANTVVSGQRILIPTHNYAKSVSVSAPDSNPVANVSRSSSDLKEQAINVVAMPKPRAKKVVSATVKKVASAKVEQIPAPAPAITAAKGGDYVVQSGDTLSRVARRQGVSVAALRAFNGLDKDSLQIGQSLRIPPAGKTVIAANKQKKSIDPISTGSIVSAQSKKKPVKPVYSAPVEQSSPLEQSSIAARASEKVETVAKTSAGSFRWPARGRIISKFGQRTSTGVNDGIDISMPVGTPIKASENGTVIYSGSELEDFGKLILLSHEGGWVTAYAHASATLVRRGDKVRRGQVIAKSGRSGNATSPILHFEIRKNSQPINPLKQLGK